ncbi:MAG: hypothetical protein ACI4V1_02680 [Eubacteriales bacterium]
MPHCSNCGCDISENDRTKLCDRCKQIILPFIKFMDASTSSAVRRLVSNEKNLRKAGVTDSGMDYLLRICELHDRKKLQEREARERERAAENPSLTPETPSAPPQDDPYTEIELPMDEPLNLRRSPYGRFLPAVMYALLLLGIAAIVCEIVRGGWSVSVFLCAAGLLLTGYVAFVCRTLLHDLEEIKKRFR